MIGQRTVNVIRQAINQEIENGARVKYMPAQIYAGGGAYECSAYIGASEYLSDSIRVPAGLYVNSGDYVIVGMGDIDKWIVEILPYSMYARMVMDYNNARLAIGSGSAEASDFGEAGQVLTSGGPSGPMTWEDAGSGSLTDHTHAATGSGATGGGDTLSPVTLNLPASASPSQTTDAQVVWDSDDNVITVGDGAATKEFGYLGSTSPTTQAFGDSAAAGTSKEVSHIDHKHAMMANPVTAHEAASDPHTGYQRESEKSAANGYASLDGSTKVPIGELPTGTSSTTVSLGDHTHSAPTAPIVRVYTSSSGTTWNKPAGLAFLLVECWGSGGAGGGCAGTNSSQNSSSGGGGGGGYTRKMFTAAELPASATATAGAGGTAGTAGDVDGNDGNASTFAGSGITTVSASGGSGGAGSNAATGASRHAGGAGGGGSGGDISITGSNGHYGGTFAGIYAVTGMGGMAAQGGRGGAAGNNATGGSGAVPGGGGGGSTSSTNEPAKSGGAGGAGRVIVTEYYW